MSEDLIKILDDDTPFHKTDARGNNTPGKEKDEYGKTPRRRKLNRIIIRTMWSVFGIVTVLSLGFFILSYNNVIGDMPDIDDLKNPIDQYATVIYSSDGEEMGRFYNSNSNRMYADYEDIAPCLVDALIATEDSRFTEHSGVDVRALLRVVFKTGMAGDKSSGGGSTITQQLAKLLYTDQPARNTRARARQKLDEWVMAVKLERFYSKEEIIKLYLNQFDFLYNAKGIRSAANIYFSKEAKDLELHEAAVLVGMLKNPSLYNPVKNPDNATSRRNVVFEQMVKAKKITQAQADSLKQLPLGLKFHRIDHKTGIAPYFREELRRMMTAKRPLRSNYAAWEQQKFVDDSIAWVNNPLFGWIEKNPKPDGSKYNLYTDGLRIYTTINSRMQKYAEEAVHDHMSDLQRRFFKEKKGVKGAPYTTNRSELSQAQLDRLIERALKDTERMRILRLNHATQAQIDKEFNTPIPMTVFTYDNDKGYKDTIMSPRDSVLYHKHILRTGFMSMDPVTGYVKAYVGGPNFNFFQYDMVSTGRRQVGSTIKPFLYAYAMDEGYTPCDEFLNEQPTIYDEAGRPWSPRNSGSSHVGEMVTLRWALTNSNNWISARLMAALKPAILVRYMHNFGITNKIDPVLALCLGPCDVSVREMVGAYSAFANKGMHVEPMFVTAIADANGNVITEFHSKQNQVLSEKGYYKILSILLNVVDSGTGNRLRRAPYNLTAQMGGKTGTTNSNSDGWFMSFTPDLVSGVWVGGDERYIHFNSMANGQGASMALPIYGKYIRKVYDDPELPYNQSSRFSFPDIDLCEREYYGEYDEEESVEESFEGVFD